MARPQSLDASRSTVSRLLDPQSVALSEPITRFSSDAADGPRLTKREVTFCEQTDPLLHELTERLRRSTRTRLTVSHVARALLRAFAPALPFVDECARGRGAWRLPSNARARQSEREQFEAELAAVLAEAAALATQAISTEAAVRPAKASLAVGDESAGDDGSS